MRATLILGLLLLAGCPQQPTPKPAADTSRATPPDGAAVTPGAAPAGWPDEIALYPGAEVVEGRAAENDGKPILTVFLKTPDGPEQVIEFYGKEASQRRFTVVSSSQVQGETVSLYRRGEQTLAVSTRRSDETQLTEVELTLAGKYEEEPAATERAKSQQPDDGGKPKEPKRDSSVTEHPLLPLYPGAHSDEQNVFDGQVQRRMTSSDALPQVEAFYAEFYTGKGFAQEQRVNLTTQVTLHWRKLGESVQVNLMEWKDSSGEPATRITLTYQGS